MYAGYEKHNKLSVKNFIRESYSPHCRLNQNSTLRGKGYRGPFGKLIYDKLKRVASHFKGVPS